MIEPLGSIGLTNVGDGRDSIAVVLGLVGLGAGAALAIAGCAWQLSEGRWRSGLGLLLLGVALYALILWVA